MKFKFLSILLFLCISSGLWASEEAVLRSSEDRVACMQYIAQVLPDCITCHREESFLASVTADLHSLSGRFEQIVACADKEGFHQDAFAKFQESIEEFCDTCALVHSRIEAEQNVLPRHIRLLIRKAANIEKKLEAAGKEDSSGQALLKVGADYYHLKTMIGNWAHRFGVTLQTFASFTGNKLNRLIDNLFFRPKDWFWGHRAYTIPVAVVLTALAAGGGYYYYTHRRAQSLEDEAMRLGDALPSYQMPNLKNLGLTCYANAALKFLSVHPGIDEYIEAEYVDEDTLCRADSGIVNKTKNLRNSVKDLMQKIRSGGRGKIEARSFFSEFDKLHEDANGWKVIGDQHDSHEFLTPLLNDFVAYQNKKHCFICREKVIDTEENKVIKNEETVELVLPMPFNPSLQEAFNNYWKQEPIGLNEDNPYDHQKTKQFFLENLPDSMMLQLKRFSTTGGRTVVDGKVVQKPYVKRKINDKVSVARDIEVESKGNCRMYSIKSVIIHKGVCGGGHYYTWIRDTHEGKDYWTRHDDQAEFVEIKPENVAMDDIENNGYIFLYVASDLEG
jgi:ubiquitin C-terminal hydrolase